MKLLKFVGCLSTEDIENVLLKLFRLLDVQGKVFRLFAGNTPNISYSKETEELRRLVSSEYCKGQLLIHSFYYND